MAALTNSYLSQYIDLGVFLIIGAVLQIVGHALRAWLPPFPLFAIAFFIATLGQAYQEPHANNFVTTLKGAHRWLGFIHAMYMGGCLVGPFVSTAVATAGSTSQWGLFYTAPLGVGVVNLLLVCTAFRERITFKRPDPAAEVTASGASRQRDARVEMQKTLASPSVWLLSLYFFFFLGVAITAGGMLI